MSNTRERVAALLDRIEASQILLVEWETSLQIRLGYPLVSNGSLYLLVPDDQLQVVRDLAADVGLSAVDEATLRPAVACEMSGLAVRYLMNDYAPHTALNVGPPLPRLVFIPMSWTGITRDEVVPISADDALPPPAGSVQTIPLPVACAALVRIAARQARGSRLRSYILEGLASIIVYNLFDTSYEGNYMELLPNDQPLTDEEKLEIENAVAEMNRWVFRKDEEWAKEMLIQIISGEKSFDDLPCRKVA